MAIDTRTRAALPIVIVGIALVAAGASAWMIQGARTGLATGLLVVGGLDLLVGAALGAPAFVRYLRSRRGRVGANVAFLWLLAIALWIIVHLISSRNYVRRDLTAEGKFTISPQTRAILRDIDAAETSIRITILRQSDPLIGPILGRAGDLLEAYAAACDGLDVERIDLEFEPMRAEMFRARFRDVPAAAREGAVAFEAGSRKRLVTVDEMLEEPTRGGEDFRFRGEEVFTSALLSVTEEQRKRVLFTIGHDEATFGTTSQLDANLWASELRRLNLEVEPFELPTAARIPDGTHLIVIANPNPEAAFTDRELRLLERYVDRGGNLLVLIEPQTPGQLELGLAPALPKWLARYGFDLPEAEIVIDPPGSIAAVPIAFLTRGFGDHEASRDLAALMMPIRLARPVIPILDNPKGFETSVLVGSSEDGWAETDLSEERLRAPEYDAARDRRGPVPIAVAAESRASGARIVVIGDANTGLDVGFSDFPNRVFVMNCSNWLLRREPLVSLPSRPLDDRRLLELSRSQLATIFWVAVVGMPLIVLVFGLFVAIQRRR